MNAAMQLPSRFQIGESVVYKPIAYKDTGQPGDFDAHPAKVVSVIFTQSKVLYDLRSEDEKFGVDEADSCEVHPVD